MKQEKDQDDFSPDMSIRDAAVLYGVDVDTIHHWILQGVTISEEKYTLLEVAGIFKRSSRTLYRWLDEKTVFKEAIKIQDGWLIPRREIIRILESGTVIVSDEDFKAITGHSRSGRRVISPGIS